MGLIDNQLLLGEGQTVVTTTTSTDILNLGVANPNIGAGKQAWLRATVLTVAATTDTGTCIISFSDCATVGGTYINIASTELIDADVDLLAGDVIKVPIPENVKQFVKATFTVAGTMASRTITSDIIVG